MPDFPDAVTFPDGGSLTDKGNIAGGVAALDRGDEILWDGRTEPLEVIEPAWEDGDHTGPRGVAVEGPRGGIVELTRSPTAASWKTSVDNRVSTVVIVEKGPGEELEDGVKTHWADPTDDCPYCGHLDRYRSQDFNCEYLFGGLYGGEDRSIERTDSGFQKRLLRATCTHCGGVVYQHPGYSDLPTAQYRDDGVEKAPEASL